MGYRDITAGKKIAKPIAMRFMKSEKTGTRGIEVMFEFKELVVGSTERLGWQGWIEGARKQGESDQDYHKRSSEQMARTMDKLVNVLGYNGSEECNEEGIFTDPKVINFDMEVELVVEVQMYNGKANPKIAWVNRIGGSAFTGCSRESVKGSLDALGFKGAFLAANQTKSGLKPISDDQVPF